MIFFQTENINPVPIADELKKGEDAIKSFQNLGFDEAMTNIANSLVDFAFKLLIAIVVFYIGRFVIRKIYRMMLSVFVRRKMDASLSTFVLSLVKMLLYFILIVTVIGIIGIETSSFLAIFASAGVAIGMALSGTLQNFAGGVLILLLKPYKIGDYIEAQGYAGTVKEIQIFHTVINTIDNKAIIIPNGGLSTSSINNYSLEQYRRVDWTVCLSYGTDYERAEQEILRILNSDIRVVKKYIEEDRELRLQMHLEQDKQQEAEAMLKEEAKAGWWKRMRMRRRRKSEAFKKALQQQQEMNQPVTIEKVDRSPFVGLGEMADSSINFTVRAWTHSSNYWSLFFDMNKRFYTELPKAGFEFPFPQMDVHLTGAEN